MNGIPPVMSRLPDNTAALALVIRAGTSDVPCDLLFSAGGALTRAAPCGFSANGMINEGQQLVAKRLMRLNASLMAYGSIAQVQAELVAALQLANHLADIERTHGHRAVQLLDGGA